MSGHALEFCVRCTVVIGRRYMVAADDGLGPGWRCRSTRACDRRRRWILDIGRGVLLQPIGTADSERRAGWIVWHRRADSPTGLCGGMVFTDPATEPSRPHWTIVNENPLTLSPSVLCRGTVDGREDGFHGFVQNGAWVSA